MQESDIDPKVDEELKKIEIESIPKSTMDQMKRTSNRFINFLKAKKLSVQLETIPKKHLNNYLRYFYSELRTLDNKLYSPPSLVCFRAALHRYLQTIRSDVNIITEPDFDTSNKMLKAMVTKYKKSNQIKSEESYPAIEQGDMLRIYHYFNRSSPERLQEEVLFNLLYYFLLRGRETLPYLNKDCFAIEKDSKGKHFVRIQCDRLSKNAKGSLLQKEYESIKNARMYEIDEPENCPVKAFKTYCEKLPNSNLFPKPIKRARFSMTNSDWYCSTQTVGKNYIGNLLPKISSSAGLSKRYTNHCVRVTAISVLKSNGKTNEEIAQYSGHKNPQSVQRYCRKRRKEEKNEVSDILYSGLKEKSTAVSVGKSGKIIVKEKTPSSSVEFFGIQSQQVAVQSTTPTITVNLNGNFHGCRFSLGESSSRNL